MPENKNKKTIKATTKAKTATTHNHHTTTTMAATRALSTS